MPAAPADVSAPPADAITSATGLASKVIQAGSGAEKPGPADTVTVHYTGWTTDGKQFDSSVGKDPFSFTIGQGQVIKGWDEGVPGMRVGGKRKLTIPWQLAYGENGSGEKIPPKAALKFDIELLEIEGAAGGTDAGAAGAKKK